MTTHAKLNEYNHAEEPARVLVETGGPVSYGVVSLHHDLGL